MTLNYELFGNGRAIFRKLLIFNILQSRRKTNYNAESESMYCFDADLPVVTIALIGLSLLFVWFMEIHRQWHDN